ncbi:MAG TPA: 50S ribosomal protein L29 [Rhodothermales bacterium]|nr:50S ribosomal protein L29 [Rhodothermales bacterium]HRR09692.1 50S ribosomal protein L29 [Rhodothermales bacterium]
MKTKEIREMSASEIEAQIADHEAQYRKLKFQHTIANLENPMQMRNTRRAVARLKTILAEKLAAAAEA